MQGRRGPGIRSPGRIQRLARSGPRGGEGRIIHVPNVNPLPADCGRRLYLGGGDQDPPGRSLGPIHGPVPPCAQPMILPFSYFLPWLEFFCGAALIIGLWIPAAALWANILLIIFTAAIASNLIRGGRGGLRLFGETKNSRRFLGNSDQKPDHTAPGAGDYGEILGSRMAITQPSWPVSGSVLTISLALKV